MARFLSFRDGGKTDERGISQYLAGFASGEVITGFAVTQSSPLAMSVKISKGRAMIDSGSDYPYLPFTDSDESTSINTADGSNPRIDTVVAYIDKSVVDPSTSNNPNALKFKAVAGTPAGSPSAPSSGTITSSIGAGNPYIKLANVAVGAGVTNITNGNITDTRTMAGVDKIKDGAVTPPKLSTSPIGFGLQEIARTTLSSVSDTITVSSIPAKNHIRILVSYTATGGTADASFKINNLSSSIYRISHNVSGAIATNTDSGAVTSIPLDSGVVASGVKGFSTIDMWNNSGGRRIGNLVTVTDTSGPLNWLRGSFIIDTTSQMTRFDLINAGTGDFASGSEIIILGTD